MFSLGQEGYFKTLLALGTRYTLKKISFLLIQERLFKIQNVYVMHRSFALS